MTTCARCGNAMPDTAAICPSCGTISSFAQPSQSPPTGYEQEPNYLQGYSSQPGYAPPSGPGYASQQSYSQPYNSPPVAYSPVAINVNVTPVAPAPAINTGAIVAEVLLNLCTGIYGVGWLMAGETTTGIILLVCSILLYWPVMILGTILTLGLGLICLGPLAIGGLILNVVLLNNTLKRKATYVMAQPVQTFPPR